MSSLTWLTAIFKRMNSFEADFREIRTILAELIESNREMTESNRRVIGFQTPEDE